MHRAVADSRSVHAIEEATGLGNRPNLFSPGKWDLVIVLGVIFVAVAAAAIVSGVVWTFRSLSGRSRRSVSTSTS
jgi:hypothetical protein